MNTLTIFTVSLSTLQPQATLRGQRVDLVRVRNPWGNSAEWRGAWADNSAEWNQVDPQDKKRLNVTFSSDGEFW